MNFAKNATIFSSETLKNAMSTKKRKIRMAKNVAITFEDQDTLEKTTSAIAIPIANIKS